MAASAEHQRLLVEHMTREEANRGPLPFSDAEERALALLRERIAAARTPPFPVSDAPSSGAALALLLAGGAYLALKKDRHP
jgi:hypothetical protein